MFLNPALAVALISFVSSIRNESFHNNNRVKRSVEFEKTYVNKELGLNYNMMPKGILKPLNVVFSKEIETHACFENLNFYISSFENKDGELEIYRPDFLHNCDKIIYERLSNDENISSNFKNIVFNNISDLGPSYEYYQ